MKTQRKNDFPTEKELNRIGWVLVIISFSFIICGLYLMYLAWS